jgi:hypothetical protein
MNNAMLKAIGIGVGTFVVMMLIFWAIASYTGTPFFKIPKRSPVVQATPTPTPPPFLK